MAWTAPMTAVYLASFTAAQWNTHIRDNSNETMPAKATQTASRWMVSTGANAIAQRAITSHVVATSQTTTSTSYTDLTTVGPTCTVTTGARALVFFAAKVEHSATDGDAWASVAVSSATTRAASDVWAMRLDGVVAANANAWGNVWYVDDLTPGSNVFTMKYKVGSGTGTWSDRQMTVVGM